MQLVAASKMKKAQMRARSADAYAYGALEILKNITEREHEIKEHVYWKGNAKQKKIGMILISTNRGFCGGLSISLFQKVLRWTSEMKKGGHEIDAVTIGKKGRIFAKKIGMNIVADFSDIQEYFSIRDIGGITKIATQDFRAGAYGKVYVAYNQFVNVLIQKPVIRQTLPIEISSFEKITETDNEAQARLFKKEGTKKEEEQQKEQAVYVFEPSPVKVFEELVPYLIEVEIYKALLEAQASEHSARMVAMKNATDKGGELIGDLQLSYNQARQASITQEIAEIASGAMATA